MTIQHNNEDHSSSKNFLGLSSSEVTERLRVYGPNEITQVDQWTFFHELKRIFSDPMGLMLLLLAMLYYLLGNHKDATFLFLAFIPVTAIDVFLELRSNRALKALRAQLVATVNVIRNGVIQSISARDLVPDDLILFEEGQILPADGVILEAEQLSINEAALTGESEAVVKLIDDSFYCGTMLMTGRGVGKVQKTASLTEFGKIAKLVKEHDETISPFKKTVDAFVKKIFLVAVLVAFILFLIHFFSHHGLIESIIASLTLAMAAIPEEFPLVFTLYLSLGAWRLSKKGVLIKSLPSVETLGAVDIICTDKTGTLTEGLFQLEHFLLKSAIDQSKNIMKDQVEVHGKEANDSTDIPDLEQAWEFAMMACEARPIDLIELAIERKYESLGYNKDYHQKFVLKYDYPFEYEGKHMTHVWATKQSDNLKDSDKFLVVMKGAVEGILDHCELSASHRKIYLQELEAIAKNGKRVLGVAYKWVHDSIGDRLIDEQNLIFLGFLIFSDPVRESVRNAILSSQQAGIHIKMLTGDHLLTAHAVAEEIGLEHVDEFLYTGRQLEEMSLEQRQLAYDKGAIFARVTPVQKFEMVQHFRQQKLVVAMTGDGMNDAPSLKLADIGISMGSHASDIARSSAKMILMNNSFTGIVDAIFEGRKIFANLRMSFSYLIAFHVPLILLTIIPSLLHWPMLLMPVHLVLLEMIVHPISAFTFENLAHPQLLKNNHEHLLSKQQIINSSLLGVMVSLVTLLIFSYNFLSNELWARKISLSFLILSNIFLMVHLVGYKFYLRIIYSALLLVLLVLALNFIPFLRSLFYL